MHPERGGVEIVRRIAYLLGHISSRYFHPGWKWLISHMGSLAFTLYVTVCSCMCVRAHSGLKTLKAQGV